VTLGETVLIGRARPPAPADHRLQEAIVRLALVVAAAVVMAAGPGQADEFRLQYQGGKPDLRKKTNGALVIEPEGVYFKDRHGRRLLTFTHAGTSASVQVKNKKSFGCVVGMMPVALAFYGAVDPEASCERKHWLVEVHHGADTLTFRSSAGQAAAVVAAINEWAARTSAAAPSEPSV
jgi:hypothetical protein